MTRGRGGVLANDDVITGITCFGKFLGFFKEFLQNFPKNLQNLDKNFSTFQGNFYLNLCYTIFMASH